MKFQRATIRATLLLLGAPAAMAQTVLVEVPAPNLTYASRVTDVDGDGYPDFALASYQPERVEVFSGASGALVTTIPRYGLVFDVGDLDGDGSGDLVISDLLNDVVSLHRGANGELLFETFGNGLFGVTVDGLDDLDGDGMGELLIGDSDRTTAVGPIAGRALILSTASGAALHTFDALGPQDNFGRSVTTLGDVNGNGSPDVAVGAEDPDGYVRIFDGGSGQLLHHLAPPGPSPGFGLRVKALGDLDGDGVRDLGITHFSRVFNLDHLSERVHAYSPVTGASLFSVRRCGDEEFGRDLGASEDYDGDGVPDLVTGHVNGMAVLSGVDGSELARFEGAHDPWVDLFPDLDGDGRAEVFVAARFWHAQPPGVRIYSDPSVPPVGTPGCPGDVPAQCPCGIAGQPGHGCAHSQGPGAFLEGLGSSSIARDDLLVVARGMPRGRSALLFMGTSLGPGVFNGAGRRCVGSIVKRFPARASCWTEDFISGPDLFGVGDLPVGNTRHFQVWFRDQAGCSAFNFSSSLSVTFTP